MARRPGLLKTGGEEVSLLPSRFREGRRGPSFLQARVVPEYTIWGDAGSARIVWCSRAPGQWAAGAGYSRP